MGQREGSKPNSKVVNWYRASPRMFECLQDQTLQRLWALIDVRTYLGYHTITGHKVPVMAHSSFRFFDLPAELRDLIYVNLTEPTPWLSRNHILATIEYAFEDGSTPNCLLVSRRFHREYSAQIRRTVQLNFGLWFMGSDTRLIQTLALSGSIRKVKVTIDNGRITFKHHMQWHSRLTEVLPKLKELEISVLVDSSLLGQESFKGKEWHLAVLAGFEAFIALPRLGHLHVMRHRVWFEASKELMWFTSTSSWATWTKALG